MHWMLDLIVLIKAHLDVISIVLVTMLIGTITITSAGVYRSKRHKIQERLSYRKELPRREEMLRRNMAASVSFMEDTMLSCTSMPYGTVSFYFGTDRKLDKKEEKFTRKSAKNLSYGRALVTIPVNGKFRKLGEMAEAPLWKRIYQSDAKLSPERYIRLTDVGILTKEQFQSIISKEDEEQVLLFVHGYNNSFKAAAYRFAQIIYDTNFKGIPLMYSWPSKGCVFGYSADVDAAEASAKYLTEFLESAMASIKARKMCVIAHSMGNRAFLKNIGLIKQKLPNLVINEIVMAAPDIDAETFTNVIYPVLCPQAPQQKFVNGLTLYASSWDWALWLSKWRSWGRDRIGEISRKRTPFIVAGIDTIDISNAAEFFSLNHSCYATDKTVLNDIGLVINTGTRPPNVRTPILESMPARAPQYWKYPR